MTYLNGKVIIMGKRGGGGSMYRRDHSPAADKSTLIQHNYDSIIFSTLKLNRIVRYEIEIYQFEILTLIAFMLTFHC